jgi:hypothetical protein
MNSRILRSSRRSPAARKAAARKAAAIRPDRPDLTWIHDGLRYRATVWPEVRFGREVEPGKWTEGDIGEAVFASAALGVTGNQWRRYLEFVPASEQEFLLRFQFGRMAALHVLTQCPALLPELSQLPALVPFLTAHLSLRGGSHPAWGEITAVFERDGLFGVLLWIGLPASRETVAILRNIADPDIPRRLLEPLRAALWEPEAIWALSHLPMLTDERLAEACHALAA